MGRPKALLPVASGETLLERTVRVVSAAGLAPVLVGRRAELPELELLIAKLVLPVLADAAPNAGPLGGLVSLLEEAGDHDVLALSCDLPHVQPEHLRALFDSAHEAAVVAPRRDGRWEPLAARYSARILDVARARLAAGKLGLQGLLDEVHAVEPLFVSDLGWLDDWDTPDDLPHGLHPMTVSP